MEFESFKKRVTLKFRVLGIELNGDNAKNKLLASLFNAFKEQGRKGIPYSFVYTETAKFLGISDNHLSRLLTTRSSPRTRYQRESFSDIELKAYRLKSNLIKRLGRKSEAAFKLTDSNGDPLTPNRQSHIGTKLKEFRLSFSPLSAPAVQQDLPKTRAENAKGELYEKDMESQQFALWRKKTPHKDRTPFFSPNRVKRSSKLPDSPEFMEIRQKLFTDWDMSSPKTETFSFSVTAEDIQKRVGMKRPISQKAVMGG